MAPHILKARGQISDLARLFSSQNLISYSIAFSHFSSSSDTNSYIMSLQKSFSLFPSSQSEIVSPNPGPNKRKRDVEVSPDSRTDGAFDEPPPVSWKKSRSNHIARPSMPTLTSDLSSHSQLVVPSSTSEDSFCSPVPSNREKTMPLSEIFVPFPSEKTSSFDESEWKNLYYCSKRDLYESRLANASLAKENRSLKREIMELQRTINFLDRSHQGYNTSWAVPGSLSTRVEQQHFAITSELERDLQQDGRYFYSH